MSDQEYKAVIEAYPRWKRAKLACVESILRRFSYEVNTKVGELNLSLSDRLDYWKKLYSDLKADVSASAPLANPAAINGDHYFYAGMMEPRDRQRRRRPCFTLDPGTFTRTL